MTKVNDLYYDIAFNGMIILYYPTKMKWADIRDGYHYSFKEIDGIVYGSVYTNINPQEDYKKALEMIPDKHYDDDEELDDTRPIYEQLSLF